MDALLRLWADLVARASLWPAVVRRRQPALLEWRAKQRRRVWMFGRREA